MPCVAAEIVVIVIVDCLETDDLVIGASIFQWAWFPDGEWFVFRVMVVCDESDDLVLALVEGIISILKCWKNVGFVFS